MTIFGDSEPADQMCADTTIDPLQVAIRLHEIRCDRNRRRGFEVVEWVDLDGVDRLDAVDDVVDLIDWLRASGAIR